MPGLYPVHTEVHRESLTTVSTSSISRADSAAFEPKLARQIYGDEEAPALLSVPEEKPGEAEVNTLYADLCGYTTDSSQANPFGNETGDGVKYKTVPWW